MEKLLTAKDVAELLQVGEDHAYELMATMNPVRFGHTVRVKPVELEAWVSEHQDVPKQKPQTRKMPRNGTYFSGGPVALRKA